MLDKDKVKYLAELAKIELDDKQIESLLKDLNQILDYVSQIQNLDLRDVEPMIGGPFSELILREDVERVGEEKVENSKIVEQIIENFPDRQGRYLKVPKVLRKE
jgi:aspartyl-tRNA(Asn)/glutamyl-tRNA(Gln) amidotransferase subunit C